MPWQPALQGAAVGPTLHSFWLQAGAGKAAGLDAGPGTLGAWHCWPFASELQAWQLSTYEPYVHAREAPEAENNGLATTSEAPKSNFEHCNPDLSQSAQGSSCFPGDSKA